jgi:hypothetical protein
MRGVVSRVDRREAQGAMSTFVSPTVANCRDFMNVMATSRYGVGAGTLFCQESHANSVMLKILIRLPLQATPVSGYFRRI